MKNFQCYLFVYIRCFKYLSKMLTTSCSIIYINEIVFLFENNIQITVQNAIVKEKEN